MLQGWTCLLGSKGHMKPFLQPKERWSSMWSVLPTRRGVSGVRQQCFNRKCRLLPTGAGQRQKICGTSSGQSSHPLQKVASSWPSVVASQNAADDASATPLVWPALYSAAADVRFRRKEERKEATRKPLSKSMIPNSDSTLYFCPKRLLAEY